MHDVHGQRTAAGSRRRRLPFRSAGAAGSAAVAGEPGGELLTIGEVIAQLRVSRATFSRWRQLGRGPASIRLPNGQVRIRRAALEAWLGTLSDAGLHARENPHEHRWDVEEKSGA
jgi:predicted DNA-binding transcriptional regulator AlpA